jgi:hypothetical protein
VRIVNAGSPGSRAIKVTIREGFSIQLSVEDEMTFAAKSHCSNLVFRLLLMPLFVIGIGVSSAMPAAADWRWSATFDKTSGNNVLVIDKTWSGFLSSWKKYEKQGFRLVDFEVKDNVVRYSGVFKKSNAKSAAKIRVSLATIKKDWKALAKKGYYLKDLETWTEGKKRYFGAIFLEGKAKQALWVQRDWKGFHGKWSVLRKQGYRLRDFETWYEGNTQWYAGVFRAGSFATASAMGVTWDDFKKKRDNWKAKGYQILDLEISSRGKQRRFYGLFAKTGRAQALRVTNTRDQFLKIRKDWKKKGYKVDDLEITWFVESTKPANSQPKPPKQKSLAVLFKGNTQLDKTSGMMFPIDMPSIRWPTKYKFCSATDRRKINRAWAMGHYMMWRADQVMDWLGRNDRNRKSAWSWGYRGRNAKNGYANFAPRAWFGPYDGKRFKVADSGVERGWSNHFRGKTFTVKCRVNGGKIGAHPCFQDNPGTGRTPSANHIVRGTINFCDKFFAPRESGDVEKDIVHIYRRAHTVVHEMFHHIRLSNGQYVLDTHVHCDKGRCRTQKMYGRDRATHLSHKKGVNSGHYKRALRNNDNYANFAFYVGVLAYDKVQLVGFGHLSQFPPRGFKYK